MSGFWTGPRIGWAVLSAMYLVFLLWYDWSGGPLTPEEIDHYEALLQEQGLEGTVLPFTAREFAENDDGDEFFMVNLTIPREEPLIPDDLPCSRCRLAERFGKRITPESMADHVGDTDVDGNQIEDLATPQNVLGHPQVGLVRPERPECLVPHPLAELRGRMRTNAVSLVRQHFQ